LTFGQVELVSGVKQVQSTWNTVFVSKQHPPKDVFIWELYSDTLALAQRPIPPAYQYQYSSAFMTDTGQVFALNSSADDALLYFSVQNGRQVLPFLPHGEMKMAQCFRTSSISYVSVDKAETGRVNFVFSSMEQIRQMIPRISIYATNFVSMRTLVEDTPDPNYGGMISGNTLQSSIYALAKKIEQPITPDRVSRDLNIGFALAYHYMVRMTNLYVTKPGSFDNTEFSLLENIFNLFPGEKKEFFFRWLYLAIYYFSNSYRFEGNTKFFSNRFLFC